MATMTTSTTTKTVKSRPSLLSIFHEPAAVLRRKRVTVENPVVEVYRYNNGNSNSSHSSNSSNSSTASTHFSDDDDRSSAYDPKSSATSASIAPSIPSRIARRSIPAIGLETNRKRLWHDLQTTADWGRIGNTTGMERLALSDSDRDVRDWFVRESQSLGCDVRVDKMGNIFAVYGGEDTSLAPIGMGSHLDTQPAGGMYDGILGCLAGLEVLRVLHETRTRTYCPVAAIVWTNEEGARFNPGCSGSAVWSGCASLTSGHAQADADGITIGQELKRIGYMGPYYPDYRLNPLSAHFELHIEQGSKLEDAGKRIGVVNGVQGIRWYKASTSGVRAHAGSTKMCDRADALVATARLVTLLQRKAIEHGGVATVGMLELDRPSSNTIPGSTEFTIDIRHPTYDGLNGIEMAVRNDMAAMSQEDSRLSFTMDRVWESPPARFDPTALACIRSAGLDEVGQLGCMEMESLAGHDSALVATKIPTAMIFVPSKNGLSHAPSEFTSQEDCGYGVQVLLNSVLQYDHEMRKVAAKEEHTADLNRYRLRKS